MKLLQQWASHLKDPKEKEEFKALVLSTNAVRSRLSDIIEKMKEKPKKADYTVGSWAYLQADSNGYNRALEEVQKFLGVEEE